MWGFFHLSQCSWVVGSCVRGTIILGSALLVSINVLGQALGLCFKINLAYQKCCIWMNTAVGVFRLHRLFWVLWEWLQEFLSLWVASSWGPNSWFIGSQKNWTTVVPFVLSFEIGVTIPVLLEIASVLWKGAETEVAKNSGAEMGILPGTVELGYTRCIIPSV